MLTGQSGGGGRNSIEGTFLSDSNLCKADNKHIHNQDTPNLGDGGRKTGSSRSSLAIQHRQWQSRPHKTLSQKKKELYINVYPRFNGDTTLLLNGKHYHIFPMYIKKSKHRKFVQFIQSHTSQKGMRLGVNARPEPMCCTLVINSIPAFWLYKGKSWKNQERTWKHKS